MIRMRPGAQRRIGALLTREPRVFSFSSDYTKYRYRTSIDISADFSSWLHNLQTMVSYTTLLNGLHT